MSKHDIIEETRTYKLDDHITIKFIQEFTSKYVEITQTFYDNELITNTKSIKVDQARMKSIINFVEKWVSR